MARNAHKANQSQAFVALPFGKSGACELGSWKEGVLDLSPVRSRLVQHRHDDLSTFKVPSPSRLLAGCPDTATGQ